MLWRIRTVLTNRTDALAELTARCGADEIDILSIEMHSASAGLVVSAGVGWDAARLAALVDGAGSSGTTVRPCQADVATDGPTRYLRSVVRLIEDPCAVDEELERLQGFDEYTAAEWARADALVEIAGRLAAATDTAVPDDGDYGLTRGSSDLDGAAASRAPRDNAREHPVTGAGTAAADAGRGGSARGDGAARLVRS